MIGSIGLYPLCLLQLGGHVYEIDLMFHDWVNLLSTYQLSFDVFGMITIPYYLQDVLHLYIDVMFHGL